MAKADYSQYSERETDLVITAEYSQLIIKHLLYHNCADLNSHVIG